MAGGLRVQARRHFTFSRDIGLYIWSAHGEERRDISVAQPLTFQRLRDEDLGKEHAPALSLPVTAAQELMDELWVCGVRPSEGTGSAGALAATQAHLQDMKRIAFHSLKIAEPAPSK